MYQIKDNFDEIWNIIYVLLPFPKIYIKQNTISIALYI